VAATLFTWARPAAVPETLVVRDCHLNRALIVLEDEPLSLWNFPVPLLGADFYLSLFQTFKLWAGHFDLLGKVMRQSGITAAHSVLRDISPLEKAVPDIGCHASKEQYACQQEKIYDLPRAWAHVIRVGGSEMRMGYPTGDLYGSEKTALIYSRFNPADCARLCAHAPSLVTLSPG
jgi:hypothetical protein